MKIKAKNAAQLNGHIYWRNEEGEYDGPITQRVADNFTMADGTPLTVSGTAETMPTPTAEESHESQIEKTVRVMGRTGIINKLDAMGIAFSPNAKTAYLAKVMLMANGEITE